MEGLNFRERLKTLRLYSQERRRERYAVILIWKISENLVNGYDLKFTNIGRRGRMCRVTEVPRTAPAQVRRALENSLAMKGAKLFNVLPAELRNISSNKVITFKRALDKYLSSIRDEPTIVEEGRAAESNSLLCQIPLTWRN